MAIIPKGLFKVATRATPRVRVPLNRIHFRRFHPLKPSLLDFDPYQTLGIDKLADAKDIKKAYYQLVKKYHPDVNKEPDAEKRFHKIQELYELLSDKDKRAQYDQFGPNAFDNLGNANSNPFAGGNPFGGAGGAGGNPFAGYGFNFEDLFKEAFTGGGRRGGSQGSQGGFFTEHVGDNIEVLKLISFKDAIFGVKTTINYSAVDTCHTCSGLGLKTGKHKTTCPTCHGTGQLTHIIGGFHMASTCSTCQGLGVVIPKADECITCHGRGVEEVPKLTTVDIPPGIADGLRLRVPGAGDAPFVTKDAHNHTRHGDLLVRVLVKSDPKFTRHGNNLVIKEDILMTTAALGGEIIVPTIDGAKIKLKVRPGVQNGRKLTIPDKGVPINRNINNRGDLEVVLNVKAIVPETPLQTALLEALADAVGDKNAKRTPGESHLDVDDLEKDVEQLKDKNCEPGKLRGFLGKLFGGNAKKSDE